MEVTQVRCNYCNWTAEAPGSIANDTLAAATYLRARLITHVEHAHPHGKTKALTLYEISANYLTALEALTDPEADIPDEAIRDTLEGIEGELKEKSIAVAQFTKNLEAVTDSIRVAELRMERRRKAIEKRAQVLRDYMKFWMEQSGITKIESPWFVLSVVKNPPGVTVLDEALIPSEHKEIVTTIKLNKLSIKKAIQSGQDVPGACLESGTRLSIK